MLMPEYLLNELDEEGRQIELAGDGGSDSDPAQIKIYDKQALFYNLTCGIQGFVGGRGIGKTKMGCLKVCYLAKNKEPWMVISPDANVIEDTTWPCFEETARDLGIWKTGVRSPVHRAWIRTWDGGETNIVFKGAEKPDKLRGPSKAGLWFDEASVMGKDAYLYALPVLRWKGKMGPCLMTFTPKGRSHWTFDVFFEQVEEAEARVFGVEQTHVDGIWKDGEYVEFGGQWYKMRPKAGIVRAHTLESPFLPPEFYETLKGQYGARLSEQELSGEFIDIEGLMFRREWFQFADSPRDALRIRYWDLAGTEGEGCWTVGTLLAKANGRFYIDDVVSGQWGAMERDAMIRSTAEKDKREFNNEVIVYVEQEGAGAGKAQAQQMIRMLAGVPIYKDIPTRAKATQTKDGQKVPGQGKIIRARPLSAQVQAGNVFLPMHQRPGYIWNSNGYLDILIGFPESNRMDEVDSLAGAFNRIQERSVADPGEILAIAGKAQVGQRYGQGFDAPSFFDSKRRGGIHACINFSRH